MKSVPDIVRSGSVNCYFVKTNRGFILIDTGWANKRDELEKKLENAGCKPGNLELIILIHGVFDHSGNCAYLRKKLDTKIAMHIDDFGMIKHGDMFWNRKAGNIFIRLIAKFLFRLRKSNSFRPYLFFENGYDRSEFGFDTRVLPIPEHGKPFSMEQFLKN